MKYIISVLRRERGSAESFWQDFEYEAAPADTAAAALTAINERPELKDASGQSARPIEWECSCLQKKCGACAMVIDGRPGLACDARLSEHGERIRLEPLRKFPVVCRDICPRKIDTEKLLVNANALAIWKRKGKKK